MTNQRQQISQMIDEINASNEVVIYSKTYCPYCRAAKQLFHESMPSVQVKVVELDREAEGLVMHQTLMAKTEKRTVPNIFVQNHSIGGNDQVHQAYRDGTLHRLLQRKNSHESAPQNKARELIEQEIKNHQVVVWSKSYCPYCRATKELLRQVPNVDLAIYEIDEMSNGSSLQKELESMTDQRTVPSIFINGKHVGGNSDLQEMKQTGELDALLHRSR